MDLELLGSLGWREGLVAIIALLVLYIIVLFVRLRRLRTTPTQPSLAAQSAVAAYAAIQQPEVAESAAAPAPLEAASPERPATSPGGTAAPVVGDQRTADFPWNEPPAEIPGQTAIDALQREVYQLRCEVDELRTEVLAAREDLRRQSAQGAAPSASPLYNDAMQMAMQGHDATAIAHRCGIARAEADLVVALARNRRAPL